MAKIESMVPHILRWEVGQTKEEIKNKTWETLSPRQIYDLVRKRGYHYLPNDKGGPTMCGVTLTTFTEWRRRQGSGKPGIADLKKLEYDEWLSILKNLFWDPTKADRIANDSIALMLVDWRWVNGTQAIRNAQDTFSLVQDGIVGPKTLAALNADPADNVFMRLKNARKASYRRIVQRNPSQNAFYKGWINRTDSIEFKP